MKGFPAREGLLFREGNGSLLGKNIPARERLLLGKGWLPARKRKLSVPKKGSLSGRENFLPEMTSCADHKIGKLFPEVPKTGNFSRMEYPLILKNIHPWDRDSPSVKESRKQNW